MSPFLVSILALAAAADSLGGSPSSALFSGQKPATRVEAGWKGRQEADPLLPEEGSAEGKGIVDIRTLVRPDSRSAVFGRVRYENGFKNGVQRNTSSDYDVVYPYVMADTLTGHVKRETYAFSGGYSRRYEVWHFGLEAGYRALHEWRETDPRPRNIVSDLSAGVSAGKKVSPDYVLDASLFYRRYAQSNSVSYFNPRGANTAQFHLTGLGTYFSRFSGTIPSYLYTRYAGNGATLGLTLFPLTEKGWRAAVQYRILDNIHYLPNLNETPYTELITQDAHLSAEYAGGSWRAGADVQVQLRSGLEHVLDNGIAGAYNSLLCFHMYDGAFYEARIHGAYRAGRHWQFSSAASYRGLSEQYAYPGRRFALSAVRASAGTRYSFAARAWRFRTGLAAHGVLPVSARATGYEEPRLRRFSAAVLGLDAGFLAERPVWRSISGFARVGLHYDTLNAVYYSITIGFQL